MNASSMKLENKQQMTIRNEEKSTVFKKCKIPKKKNLTTSKNDASLNSNGLGCKSSDDPDSSTFSLNASPKHYLCKKNRSKKVCHKVNKMFTEADNIQEKLQRALSNEDKEKIFSILNEIRALSDIEKLYLYLQLPTGSSLEVDPFKQKNLNPLGKKADEEGMFAITWIQSHLEVDPDVSLPKQEVYDEYQSYCAVTGTDPLCAADFGKVMKQIFPSVKPRRLGTRGNSRYCYSGLRKKIKLTPPSVPDIQKEKENDSSAENVNDDVTAAACHLLFEWAEKLLGIKFNSLKDLAAHLLENMYVERRSVAAFTVLLDASPQLLSKGFISNEGGVKKTEAQFHLQRKLQEKELIKEQKRKLQEHRTSIVSTSASKGKSVSSKRKNFKIRKTNSSSDIDNLGGEEEKLEINLPEPTKSKAKTKENSDLMKCQEIILQVKKTESSCMTDNPNIKKEEILSKSQPNEMPKVGEETSSDLHVGSLSNISNGPSDVEDSTKKGGKNILPQNKTPVCIAQSLPGIIIVPSLPQITAEIGKQNANPPKYKRIQPKPLQGELFRSRAGSVGSGLANKTSAYSVVEGRRSSHAWLQSDPFVENGEKSIPLSSVVEEKKSSLAKRDSFETTHGGKYFSENANSNVLFDKQSKISELYIKSRLILHSASRVNSSEVEDGNSAKRHLDENDDHTGSKRFHLDLSKLSNESVWIPKSTDTNNYSSAPSSSEYVGIGHEEVNVHEIEGDALKDYFRGANNQSSIYSLPQNELEQQLSSSNKVKQLSQLRMLLEQNLPGATAKTPSNSIKLQKVSKSVDTSEGTRSSVSLNSKKRNSSLVLQDARLVGNSQDSSDVLNSSSTLKNEGQIDNLEKLFSSNYHLAQDTEADIDSQLLSDPSMFLNCSQNSIQDMDVTLQSDFNQNSSTSDVLLSSTLLNSEQVGEQINTAVSYEKVNTYTQVPSVPQSPNTRRRAFNFMPISPRHTPVPEGLPINETVSSPHSRTMMSTAVGPSQPPSNSGSPFVSPRSTPVPLSRSRHSSGQSTYSTSRHTPFQNFDSGVSSISSSPFISPQPTPVPASRLRHNSNHGSNKTVTFSSINSSQVINTHCTLNNMHPLRTRNNSGPGTGHTVTTTLSSSLSPLVVEQTSVQSFMFPSGNEMRSRHNSGSNTTTPLSPVSEQASSSSSCTSNMPDLSGVNDASLSVSQSFLNDAAGDILISANPSNFKQVRHRHTSGSVIYGKSSCTQRDIFSQEIQKLLKNSQDNSSPDMMLSNRSQSVPLHQMLPITENFCFLTQGNVEELCPKSHPSTPVMNQMFSFPIAGSNQQSLAVDIIGNRDKSAIQNSSQMEWTSFDNSAELEVNSVRRNLSVLYDAPVLSDDLQTTLEDLRDCDTDFSKLELELRQNEENGL